jgi:hypothetical protein
LEELALARGNRVYTYRPDQYCFPYMLDRWSESSRATYYEVVQNGHWIRRNEDPRLDAKLRHTPILTRMDFDRRSVPRYAFMPRLFNSPLHLPYRLKWNRNFDQYDWPTYYYNNERRKFYPRTPVRYNKFNVDKRDPWDRMPIYIFPNYHPKTPKIFIHAWSVNFVHWWIARGISTFWYIDDFAGYLLKWTWDYANYVYRCCSVRFFSHYVYSQILWSRVGRYHLYDLWWHGYLDWIYAYQVSSVKGILWDYYWANYLATVWYGKPGGLCKLRHHQAYYMWIASLLDRYFAEYGFWAPPSVHNRCKFSNSGYLTPPTRPLPPRRLPHEREPYPNLVPPVIRHLEKVLEDFIKIVRRTTYSTAGPAYQAHIEECRKHYPSKDLVRDLNRLLRTKEKYLNKDKAEYWNR